MNKHVASGAKPHEFKFCFFLLLLLSNCDLRPFGSLFLSLFIYDGGIKIISTLLKGLNQLYGLKLTSIKYCTNVSCFIMIFSQIL